MKKPKTKPESLCLAPWTHTYISPQTERRLCCASREQARSFTQYIDAGGLNLPYQPQTLEEHWNSPEVRAVRVKMMNGEQPSECEVCDSKMLNTDVYRDYFWHLFKHRYDEIWDSTDAAGFTTMRPISWDYRFSNLCNFKCRMCGDMLSSAWETEQKVHRMVDLTKPKNRWMADDVRPLIAAFQDTQVEREFAEAVDNHQVEEIYWVGGEPLMYDQHWRYMKQIIDQGDGQRVYARYNTNLSRVEYRGVNLYRDILANLRDWQVCASLDGTGKIGEYIRTGLDYEQWRQNYRDGVAIQRHPRQMRIDFTLTLPGLFEVENIIALARETRTAILAKVVFAFDPSIMMSPLALPRTALEPFVRGLLDRITPGADHTIKPMVDILENLLTRPTFAEQWPDQHAEAAINGKRRILQIERIRPNPLTFEDILRNHEPMIQWWNAICV